MLLSFVLLICKMALVFKVIPLNELNLNPLIRYDSIDNKSYLIPMMAWRPTDGNPLTEQIEILFTYVYMRPLASTS